MSHVKKVIDADPHFVIDINTRNIKNVSQSKVSLVQYDHNSERFSFALPRFVEGHDMLECNSVQVHYFSTANPDTKGVYEITDLAICEEGEEQVCCTWLISQNVTQATGAMKFLLRFACIGEAGAIEYAWHTNPFTGISITAGMNNADAVVEQYADVLEQWKVQLFSLAEEEIRNILFEKTKNVSNALKGTASGQIVEIDDISPIPHTIKIKGKVRSLSSNETYNWVEAGDTSTAVLNAFVQPLELGCFYTVSFDTENTGAKLRFIGFNNFTSSFTRDFVADGTRKHFTFEMTEDYSKNFNITLVQQRSTSTAPSGLCSNLTIVENTEEPNIEDFEIEVHIRDEYGYEEYVKSIYLDENGNGEVTSIYPFTGLWLMSGMGTIDVEYNRDINKAFEELTQAIISLGGNV